MNPRAPTILVCLLAVGGGGCGRPQTHDQVAADTVNVSDSAVPDSEAARRTPPVPQAPKTIDAVLAEHNDSLLAVPGVVGTAVGRCAGAPCIRVLVTRTSDELRRRIPRELEGFPVQIDVTGPVVPR
jgi:hypothetical protein